MIDVEKHTVLSFPLWEIADVQPLLDTVNDGTNKIDETMTTQQTNISKNTESIAQLKNNSTATDENIAELSKKKLKRTQMR